MAVLHNTRKFAFKKCLCGWSCCSLLSGAAGFSSHSELRGRGEGGLVGSSELCNPAQAAIVGFEMVPQHSDHAETPDEY